MSYTRREDFWPTFFIEVPRVPHKDLTDVTPAEDSATIRQRVNRARQIQYDRQALFGLHANSQMQARHVRRFCKLDDKGDALLEQVTYKFGLSARSFTRILKLARTICSRLMESPTASWCDSIHRAHHSVPVFFHAIQYWPGNGIGKALR